MKKELLINDTMMALSKVMIETNQAVAEADPEYKDPRIQAFAGDMTRGITTLMDMGLDLMRYYAESRNDDALVIDQQIHGMVTFLGEHNMVVSLDDGTCHAFDPENDLGVQMMQGSIRKPDGTVARNAWSYPHVLEPITGLHQIVCEGVIGWVVYYTNGQVGFTPRPVSEQCNDVDYKSGPTRVPGGPVF